MRSTKTGVVKNKPDLTQCERDTLAHNELLFAVHAEDREFRMYTNGRTEGFRGRVGVSNRFPRLCSDLPQGTRG